MKGNEHFFPCFVSFCFSPSDPHTKRFHINCFLYGICFPYFFPSHYHSVTRLYTDVQTYSHKTPLRSTEIALHCNFIHFYFPILVLSLLCCSFSLTFLCSLVCLQFTLLLSSLLLLPPPLPSHGRIGHKWRSHRKLIAPTFHLNVLKGFIDLFNENSRQVIKKMDLEIGKTFDAHDHMSEATVEILLGKTI